MPQATTDALSLGGSGERGREGARPLFLRHPSLSVMLGVIGIAVGIVVLSHRKVDALEVDALRYRQILEAAERHPQVRDEVRHALLDGRITWAEDERISLRIAAAERDTAREALVRQVGTAQ